MLGTRARGARRRPRSGIVYQRDFCGGCAADGACRSAFEAAGGEVVERPAVRGHRGRADDRDSGDHQRSRCRRRARHPDLAGLAVTELVAARLPRGDCELGFVGLGITDHSARPARTAASSDRSRPCPASTSPSSRTSPDRLLEINPALTDFSYAAETLRRSGASGARRAPGELLRAPRMSQGHCAASREAKAVARSRRTSRARPTSSSSGGAVDYDGISGPIAFDANGDPLAHVIGLYEYQDDNTLGSARLVRSRNDRVCVTRL